MPDTIDTTPGYTPQELQASFDAELQRLLAQGLTPEDETLARRYYSDKERQGMDEGSFCGPSKSFPVQSQEDVTNAADPGAVRACIKRKAKANGWSLPKSWESGDSGDKKEERAVQEGDFPTIYTSMPLVRIDATKRQVWGQATAEVPDSYGTIFGYYPEGWQKWRGNIREQHDAKKAVGTRIELECDDMSRSIFVGSHISRGAQDTWLKVEDNVLTGYSASIIPDPEFGKDISRWPKKEYNGKLYPYIPRYTVAELSLVDNPSTPGCNIQIVRAEGFVTDVVEDLEPLEQKQETHERIGARIGSATKGKMHDSIAHTLHAAVSQMQNCGCDSCMKAQKMIDPDGDGDIDIGSYDDPDGDGDDLTNGRDGDMPRAIEAVIERILTQQLSSVYTRLQGIAGTLARSNAPAVSIESIVQSSITRAFEGLDSRLATLPSKASLDEVRTELSVVKGQVERIAETPMPGSPIQNAGALSRAVDKALPTDPYRRPTRSGSSVYDAVAALNGVGALDTTEKQVDAMAEALTLLQQGR